MKAKKLILVGMFVAGLGFAAKTYSARASELVTAVVKLIDLADPNYMKDLYNTTLSLSTQAKQVNKLKGEAKLAAEQKLVQEYFKFEGDLTAIVETITTVLKNLNVKIAGVSVVGSTNGTKIEKVGRQLNAIVKNYQTIQKTIEKLLGETLEAMEEAPNLDDLFD